LTRLRHKLVHLGGIRRPGSFLAVEIEGLVDVEIRLLGEQFDGVIHRSRLRC